MRSETWVPTRILLYITDGLSIITIAWLGLQELLVITSRDQSFNSGSWPFDGLNTLVHMAAPPTLFVNDSIGLMHFYLYLFLYFAP